MMFVICICGLCELNKSTYYKKGIISRDINYSNVVIKGLYNPQNVSIICRIVYGQIRAIESAYFHFPRAVSSLLSQGVTYKYGLRKWGTIKSTCYQ